VCPPVGRTQIEVESRVLRRIFGSKGEKVRGDWRKLDNDGLYHFYSSPNIIRVIRSSRIKWAGHVACMGEVRYVHKILARKH
jgi:hypothetical protein